MGLILISNLMSIELLFRIALVCCGFPTSVPLFISYILSDLNTDISAEGRNYNPFSARSTIPVNKLYLHGGVSLSRTITPIYPQIDLCGYRISHFRRECI